MQLQKAALVLVIFVAAAWIPVKSANAGTQYIYQQQQAPQVYPAYQYPAAPQQAVQPYQYQYPRQYPAANQYPIVQSEQQQYPAANQYPVQPYPAVQPVQQYPAQQYAAANQYPIVQPVQQQYPAANQYPAQSYSAAQPVQQYPTQQYAAASQYSDPQPPTQQPMPQYPTPQYQYQPAPASVAQLPSYPYDQQLDPRYQPPYHPPKQEDRPSSSSSKIPYLDLKTRSGVDVTGQFSYYKYSEPSLGVSETSSDPFLGLGVSGTLVTEGYFFTLEGRYAFADIDYKGSGELKDRSVVSWEWRGLFGKDFVFDEFSVSPYLGFGYRTLFNDNRGVSTTNAGGYRRYNELYYLPFGVHPRARLDTNSRLTSTFEFDAVFHGMQKSDLSDVGLGDPNIKSGQSSGYGLRGDIMYERRDWSIGPYFTYWNIDQSKTKIVQDNSVASCGSLGAPCQIAGDEPANNTFEAGVQFRYHFF